MKTILPNKFFFDLFQIEGSKTEYFALLYYNSFLLGLENNCFSGIIF